MDEMDGWMDGMGVSKVSLNVLHTFWVSITCSICTYIYIVKNFHQHYFGFQILMSCWGWGMGEHHFQNYTMFVSFQIFGSKLVIYFLIEFIRFFENLKNVFCHYKFQKIGTKLVTLFFEVIHFFDPKERDKRARSAWCDVNFKKMEFSRATRFREVPDANPNFKN